LIGASAGGILLALFAIFISASDAPAAIALRSASGRMAPLFARGEIYEALYQMDPHRARYLMYGLRLFLDSPWIGHGFNSFQVELMRFAPGEAPDLLIDNPANLVLGLLSDSGVIGGACFLGPFVLTLRRFWRVRGTGTVVPVWLAGLTIAFWPAMMIGYHLVFAEFAALLFLPLYAGRSDERERAAPIVPSVPDDAFPAASEPGIRRRAWHYAYFVIMGAASLLYAAVAAWQLATARVDPSAWRAPERGGQMRPAPAETRKNCAYDFSECYRTRLNRPGKPGKSLFG
jgi:hypothetical protein